MMRTLWRRWGPDVAALAGLAGLLAVFFAPILWQGRWMPAGGGDLAGFLYPLTHYTVESLRAGRLPLWNPHLYSGAPHLADIQTAVLYPPNLLLALLPGDVTFRRLEWLSVFHFWLTGALMYVCLRLWDRPTISRPAALLGAIAFGLSDLFFTHFGNLNLIASASWLPLVMLGARRGGRVGVLVGSGALAMSALAGHTQPLLHILLALAVYGTFLLVTALFKWEPAQRVAQANAAVAPGGIPPRGWRNGRRPASILYPLASVLLLTLLGLALAALTLLPAFELTGVTRRAGLSYTDASLYALPTEGLIGLVAPHLHGRGPAGFWADWPRVEVGYVGVVTLVLAAIGLLRGRSALFWATLAGLALLLALGPATPLHRLFYDWVPGMSQLRAPARLILLMDFGLAGLAALGLDVVLKRNAWSLNPRRQEQSPLKRASEAWGVAAIGILVVVGLGGWLLVAGRDLGSAGGASAVQLATAQRAVWGAWAWLGLSGLLVVGAGLGWLRGRAVVGVALALLACDLLVQGYGVDVGDTDPTTNYQHPAALAFLQGDTSQYRIEVRGESWGAWAPNLALVAGLDDVNGIYNPLQIADYQLYWESLTERATRLYDFLNAKYVVGPKDFALPWGKFVPVFDSDPAVNIYLNTEALPRAQLIYRSRVLADSRAQFEALRAPDFEPTQTVILASGAELNNAPSGESALNIAAYAAERIALDVTAAADAYLVLSEVYYPGWQATVDGQLASVERANFAFRAVRVPAGNHRVEWRFEPLSWRLGLTITLIALLLWTRLALSLRQPQRRLN